MSTLQTEHEKPKALVSATPAAIEAIKELLQTDGAGKSGVRLGVKGGGCSGFSYVLDYDDQREGDNLVEQDGIRFYMDRKSSIYLKGIQLDFAAGLKGKGFVFRNPNATSTCGCGESFSV